MSVTGAVQKWAVVDDLLVSVTSVGVTNDRDWGQFIKALRTEPIRRYLAASLGKNELTSVRRKEAAELFKAKGIRTAVVTEDTFTRGMITAVSWLGANVAAYSWSDTSGALKYLGVEEPLASRALDLLARLRVSVEMATRS